MGEIAFFGKLSRQEMEDLVRLDSNVMCFAPSEFIICEGKLEFSVHIPLKGIVRIAKSNANEVTLTKLKTSAIFGELSWMGKRPWTTSVIADGDVIALKLDLESFDSLGTVLARKLQDQFMGILVSRLEKMNGQLSSLVR
ncbi:MAG: cyclic nucleotide-binding domain-containing protein [Nitrospinota bacterium]|nr:cyclic nucleotide-binding domain-containing protein [Nitrospinota bacterium]